MIPSLVNNYTTRKNIYEAAIVRRRDHDDSERAKWSARANYFHKYDVQAAKENSWTSDKAFQDSMDAYKTKNAKESKGDALGRRKRRLAQLLEDERTSYQRELELRTPDTRDRVFQMKDRVESLRSAKESKRKEKAEDLLYEQFRRNNPDLRELEREQYNQHVVDGWADQVDIGRERRAVDRYEDLAYDEVDAERVKIEREEDAHLHRRRVVESQAVQQHLRDQMEVIREREAEAEQLERQEVELERHQRELSILETQRHRIEEERKKRELGRALLRQHTAALRRRSKLVQDDLEADLQFLRGLAVREAEESELKTARREKARADADWMREVVEEQLRVEKAREAELDDLFQEEAAKLWSEREAQWKKEEVARRKLMQEVMDNRADQLEEQLERNRRRQKDSLLEREKLLRDMEVARSLDRRDEEVNRREKTDRRVDLEAQMTSRQDNQWERAQDQADEVEDERRAEVAYEAMLAREAQRMKIRGYQPKSARKGAWH